MAKEICISSTPHETRLAILEDDLLTEIYYERENEYTLAGSVYKGRVTRVLPGMQSAFVDIGLERDAFLYVTDFLEMEDQEDTDEVERAASTGGPLRGRDPEEIALAAPASGSQRMSGASAGEARPDTRSEARSETRPEGRAGRPDGRSGSRSDRGGRDRRPAPPAALEPELGFSPAVSPAASMDPHLASLVVTEAATEGRDDDQEEPEVRRWRGRRQRGRGRVGALSSRPLSEGSATMAGAAQDDTEETEFAAEFPVEAETRESATPVVIHAAANTGRSTAPPFPATPNFRTDRAAAESGKFVPPAVVLPPVVLPGESLQKYGGAPVASAISAPEAGNQASAPRPSSARPKTMIETPIVWDGSGLLPGESLARHRKSPLATPAESASVADAHHAEDVAAAALPEASVSEASVPESPVPESPVSESPVSAPSAIEAAFASDEPESAPVETTSHASVSSVADPLPDEVGSAPDASAAISAPAGSEVAVALSSDAESQPVVASEADSATVLAPVTDRVESQEPAADSSASHHVDPLPHSPFRLFGFGKKKNDEAPETNSDTSPETKPARQTVSSVQAYAPGLGLIEEEVIDEDELELSPLHVHAEDHDLEDLEEETLHGGDSHRLLVAYPGKAEDEEEGGIDFEEEGDGESASSAARLPAGGAASRRGGRNRRGARPDRGANDRPGSYRPSSDRSVDRPASDPVGDRGLERASSERAGGARRGPSRRASQLSDLPIISDLLKPGQEILVQIAKEPIAKKGARITSHIALPGRFLVFMPTVSHTGVSRKIASDEERQRLKRILIHEKADAQGGFIVRTAAEGATEEELRADLRFLINLWNDIKARSDSSKPPALIYHDLSLIERILRDQVSDNFSSIWVDSEADYERIVRFLNRFSPALVRRVKLYTKETPLFEHFGIQDEISKALRSKVWLKSGGSIVINQTEALVAIDINTGKFVGKTARLEDTILKTNLDAIPEIVRQVRLRDLGGIIVIDFIDMDERKNRARVMAALEEALKVDRAPTKVLQFNDFGLVAITRKRVKQSLERTLSVPCPVCQATGMVKSPATVANEIYIEMRKMRKHFENADVTLRVNPETVKVLKANNARWLLELEDLAGKNILVKSDATLHPEQFDIAG